jgi:uncharacterized membrane protein YjgN (DUF898 family)
VNRPRPEPSRDAVAFRFTGRAGEYFRIWIVNVCLSIATLGIYSAWAKVRRKRYFYGNTLLKDAGFEYLADPKDILKGRLIVLVIWATLSMISNHGALLIAFIALLVVLPEIVIRAARFNAVNSRHRGVRFRFGAGFPPKKQATRPFLSAGYGRTLRFLVWPILLVPLSVGLLYPAYAYRKRRFFIDHTAYGATAFRFDGRLRDFYFVYATAVLFFLLFLVGTGATFLLSMKIGAVVFLAVVPLYIAFAAYRDAAVGRLTWDHTLLGPLRFGCTWKARDLFNLYVGNSLAVIFTLGLASPWVKIRTARYQLQGLSIGPAADIGTFLAAAQDDLSALGDEAGDLLGFDFGL